jgi:ribosomal protein L37AE/L43A
MPKVSEQPPGLRPLLFHGLDLHWEGQRGQARADCPFCGKEGKFYANIENGKWDCKSCGAAGNDRTFIRRLHEQSAAENTSLESLAEFARSKGLLGTTGLAAWGVCRSIISGEWLVPAHAPDGRMVQLYRYTDLGGGRMRLVATPGLGHGLMGLYAWSGHRPPSQAVEPPPGAGLLFLCEGPWDGVALWEALSLSGVAGHAGVLGRDHDHPAPELAPAAGPDASLLAAGCQVLAVPSCNTMPAEWLPLFTGADVALMYDSDHPGVHPKTGRPTEPAGYEGMRRAATLMGAFEQPPATLLHVRWGPDGYDPERPSGFDIRDWLTLGKSLPARVESLAALLGKVGPVPADWLAGRDDDDARSGKTGLRPLPCTDWPTLVNAWRNAMKWTEGLNSALACMLATISSTEMVGDQLWMRIVGPPSSGKSVLCEAVCVSKKHTHATSTFRGFHSGYKVDAEGSEDVSLLARLRNKTLVVKDGDTLLRLPNLTQVLSEARDIYDRVSRSHYRNKISRVYEGHNMTWLLCGTESLRELDSSELGERFLDVVVVDQMDSAMEDEIGWRVANRAAMEVGMFTSGRPEEQDAPELSEAKRLTGGYVEYLRSNARRLLPGIKHPSWALRRCQRLAKFVSYARARPSLRQEESAQRELSFRLTAQMVRLAKCLALVLGKGAIDDEVMRHVNRVALDTARGRTFRLVAELHRAGPKGLDPKTAALLTNETGTKERRLLHFLLKIGVVDQFQRQVTSGYRAAPRYRLTATMAGLYAEVTDQQGPTGGLPDRPLVEGTDDDYEEDDV